jgi:hypothetical protein
MSDFKFDEKTHSYTLDGKKMTGVTTVIGVLAKPALIGWAARMAADYASALIESGKEYTEDELAQIFADAKNAHTKKKDDAAAHGTDAHSAVETWVNLCLESDGKPNEYMPHESTIKPFVDWAVENVDHFLFSERRMFNEEMFVAGTADFGCVLKTGQKLIGDFKTSSGIFGIDYYLQCAGYKILAEGMGDEPYDGCVIVRLGKKGVKDFDVTYNYDTATAENAFRACLTIYRAQQALKETASRE